MPSTPDYITTTSVADRNLRHLAVVGTAPIGVDRERARINGYVVAQLGPFKSGRGQFTLDSLRRIVVLMQQNDRKFGGTAVHFTHGGLGDGERAGRFLGRARNPRLDKDRVRADLHFNPAAFDGPFGDLAGHVLMLAETDPGALSSSLVLHVERAPAPRRGDPPIWLPTEIAGSDIVSEGDAVDSLLSIGERPGETRERLRAAGMHASRLSLTKRRLLPLRLAVMRWHK